MVSQLWPFQRSAKPTVPPPGPTGKRKPTATQAGGVGFELAVKTGDVARLAPGVHETPVTPASTPCFTGGPTIGSFVQVLPSHTSPYGERGT